MDGLRGLRESEDIEGFSAAWNLLARLEIPEVQAERLLAELLRHRAAVTRALGRDPGLRVAAIDFLSNVKKLLANPAIVESSHLEETRLSAATDPLTHLYNRRHFERALALEVRRSHRYTLQLSLLMLDLDGFKRVNDLHGHLFGDLVLKRVGRVLRRAVRDADTPCRYGGEEFVVILPETDRLGAHAVAERIRRQVRRGFAERPVRGKRVEVRLSGGIASFPQDGEEPAVLIARADQALYLAKRQGRDRVSLYHAERRETIRYPAKASARVRIQSPPGARAREAHALNLSVGGILLEVGAEPAGAPVVLTFDGRDPAGRPRRWEMRGRVVRVEPAGRSAGLWRAAIVFDESLPEVCLFQQVQKTSALRMAFGGPR
jgi:diguanylate cyclase (GGDEF)-like protein